MKKFFMSLNGSQPEPQPEQEKSQIAEWAKDEIKDEIKDEALESLFENVKLLDVSAGGVATIAIPLTALQLITTMFQSLIAQIENQEELER